MYFDAKFQPNIPGGSKEEVGFVIFAILVMAAILAIQSDPILQF